MKERNIIMSDGTIGINTTLAYGTDTSTTVTLIGNISSLGGPNQTRTSIDKSTFDSSDNYKEFMPGMIDAGEITAEFNYDGSAAGTANNLNTLLQDTSTSATKIWTVTCPDTSKWQGSGFISALSPTIPMDDKITQSLTIKLTGKTTFTDVE